jgi:hypothetical protein
MAIYNWVQLLFLISGFLFLLSAIRQLRQARIIEDTPTAKLGHAHQGFVEAKGTTIDKNKLTLHVPMLKVPCVWYRFQAIYEGNQGDEVQESHQRIFIADNTGECAIDPTGAEIHPQKEVTQTETGVTYKFSWIGIGQHLHVLGWMNTLHPMPKTQDLIAKTVPENNDQKQTEHRYGQLKAPLNVIKKPPHNGLPFFIGTKIEKHLTSKYRYLAKILFFCFIFTGIFLPIMIEIFYF